MKPVLKKALGVVATLILAVWICHDMIGDGTSPGGAIFITALIFGLVWLPLPPRWGVMGYALMEVILAILITGYLILDKDRSLVQSLPLSILFAALVSFIYYMMNKKYQEDTR